MKIAFSTVCCPELTLDEVVSSAAGWGYQGVEMRLAPRGIGASPLACDPEGLPPQRLHDLFEDAGVDPVGLATGVTFDEPVWPPVVGRLFQSEEMGVPETKAAVERAAEAGIPYVRVFGQNLGGGEPRAWGVKRIVDRLALAAQTARNTRVRVLIENAGSFARAEDLRELHDMVGSQYLAVSYSTVAAAMAGECPMHAIDSIIDRTAVVRIGDIAEDGQPVPLGEGHLPNEKFVRSLRDKGYRGWIVYEYPRLWRSELRPAGEVLPRAADLLYAWAGANAAVTA